METLKRIIANKTVKLRRRIVKFLAPRLYSEFLSIESSLGIFPRPMIRFCKNYFPASQDLVGVEIGTALGDNALSILFELPMKRLILIDPYMPYVDDSGDLVSYEQFYETTKNKFAVFPQVTIIRKTSEEAANEIPEPLDFVYIDGNHSYEYVKKDITLYYPKIRQFGVLGGHDYPTGRGVKRAVDEFTKQHKLFLYCVFPDWWIIKQDRKEF